MLKPEPWFWIHMDLPVAHVDADEIHCEREVVDYVQQMMSGRKVGEAAVVLPKAVKWNFLQLPVPKGGYFKTH